MPDSTLTDPVRVEMPSVAGQIIHAETKEHLRQIVEFVVVDYLGYDFYSVLVATNRNPMKLFGGVVGSDTSRARDVSFEDRAYQFTERRIFTNISVEVLAEQYGDDYSRGLTAANDHEPQYVDPSKFYAHFTFDLFEDFASKDNTGQVRAYYDKLKELYGGKFTGFKMTAGLHAPGDRNASVVLRVLRVQDSDHDASNEKFRRHQYELAAFLRKVAERYDEITHDKTGSISPAESEVLKLLAEGYSARQIGDYLNKSPATVNKQLESVRWRLDARNSTHAVVKAIRLGLIEN